jgi:tetratricopeptide (TPR) repeat protein
VAVEVLGLGLAVGKMLLRAANMGDAADAVDDAQGGWAALRKASPPQKVLGKAIAKELRQHLGATSVAEEGDLRAAAQDVTDLLSHLAKNDDAVVAAATYPDQFFDYAKKHGGDERRRFMSERAALAFDRVLEVASAEFARLAPSSSPFLPMALAEILRQVLKTAERFDELLRREDLKVVARVVLNASSQMRPEAPSAFTGREVELRIIKSAATNAVGGDVLAICAIDGMPGIGKTALAIHAGHLLAERFPDGQLYLNLHAHTANREPLTPEEALATLLTSDGVDRNHLPEGLDQRSAMWRARMNSRRVLLVLDNAASSNQIGPLLPHSSGCLTLVTSRRHLGDLPVATGRRVVPIRVRLLTPDEAKLMFIRLGPRSADATLVALLVELCGRLPLAISLLARVYQKHQTWTLEDLIAETRSRLLTVTAEEATVAAAFGLSYDLLPVDRQRFFRHVGLHPGTTIDPRAGAALADVSVKDASIHLDGLHQDNLITEVAYRRYTVHDLIRLYLRDRVASDSGSERRQALERLLDYYQHAAAVSNSRLVRQTSTALAPIALEGGIRSLPDLIPSLADRAQALAWARDERDNLFACLDHAISHNQQSRVLALADGLAPLLHLDGPWSRAIALDATAVVAAHELGDRRREAAALNRLGDARRSAGDYTGAAQALMNALDMSQSLADRLGEATALYYLGGVRYLTDEYDPAIALIEQALSLFRRLGDRAGVARSTSLLGNVRRVMGRYPEAEPLYKEALKIYQDLGDRMGEANSRNSLGVVQYLSGDLPSAARLQQEALSIYRELDSPNGVACALRDRALVLRATGDYAEAEELCEQALKLFCHLGNRLGEAQILSAQGSIQHATGHYPKAARLFRQASRVFRDIGDRQGEAFSVQGLGRTQQATGNYQKASSAFERVLRMCRDLHDRGGEVETLNVIGALRRAQGKLDQAKANHVEALNLARDIRSPWDEAEALAGLGRCSKAAGETQDALTQLRQALEIHSRLGAVEAVEVAAELHSLEASS